MLQEARGIPKSTPGFRRKYQFLGCQTLVVADLSEFCNVSGHIRRGDAVRVAECILLHVLAGPLVCFAFPCMAAQQTAMLDLRDANPTIIRPPFDPIRVRPAAPSDKVIHALLEN